jgi:hypothetical protein
MSARLPAVALAAVTLAALAAPAGELLGPPEEQRQEGVSAVYDYGSLVVGVQDGVVTRLGIPALD